MLRAVLVVAVGAVVASGVGVAVERPDAPVASEVGGGTIDRDDFTRMAGFDGGNGGDGANG